MTMANPLVIEWQQRAGGFTFQVFHARLATKLVSIIVTHLRPSRAKDNQQPVNVRRDHFVKPFVVSFAANAGSISHSLFRHA
jgi:hypothetical protein